mmetsp:Transcript_53900/g.115099  ORF Transcript_53900/g.115099 Transcript_53900/m.115099 type:complete len:957 (-) Transcript_53900:369-3239(-)|eukprot:CAMPEP_0206492318 /NCGR_PEP_ID=MMETSP0324_2-20121206/45955_1 /ASSEMBLY_ACC=CAM_ASM_000836 /TAXON_ID=2866 /ORGANISM="Crypthecodinium cohnii, Strain Seligo" /LENGTH=956 /DNA_ID=CAMNT_0053974547 /DNA_START=30 /DNA_END=2900 /DNA_ORIENTATION=+
MGGGTGKAKGKGKGKMGKGKAVNLEPKGGDDDQERRPSNKGKEKGSGAGKGKSNEFSNGKGRSKSDQEKPEVVDAEQSMPAAGEDGDDGKVTKALVEALRAFSNPQWWTIGKGEEPVDVKRRMKPEEFQQVCTERHAQMRKVYESTMLQDSEQRWLRKVSSEGTSGDKVASLTMLVQICPVFATTFIKALLSMASRTARSDSVMALDALRDLFLNNLLPDRKLKSFTQMDPVSPKGLSKVAFTQLAVLAYFEDYLKTAFAGFVHILAEMAHTTVTFFKNKSLKTVYEMLSAKPEQERALMAMLVNKFGDHASKVSSNSSYYLKQLVEAHPGMKVIVAREVEAFLMRANITSKSRYCAVLHLSEMKFKKDKDGDLAAILVRIFVTELERALKGPEPTKVRPFHTGDRADRITKKRWLRMWRRSKRRGLQDEDNKLVRTLITGIQRAMPYLDSLMVSGGLQEETLNTLFKVCHTVSSYATRIAILTLLHRHLYAKSKGDPPNRYYQLLFEQVGKFDLFYSTHRNQACVLLGKTIRSDRLTTRALALNRRFLQVGANASAPVAVAALTSLRELLLSRRPEVRPLLSSLDAQITKPENEALEADEEHFVDDDEDAAPTKEDDKAKDGEKQRYDPTKRDPRFTQARHTPMWELYALRNHVHPFVADATQKLMEGNSFETFGAGNPFETFSISELLEELISSSRARKTKSQRHEDKMRAAKGKGKGKDGEDVQDSKRISLASDAFIRKTNVAPHEQFIQWYYRDETVQAKRRNSQVEDLSDIDEETGFAHDGDEDPEMHDSGESDLGDSDDDEDDESEMSDDDEEEDDEETQGNSKSKLKSKGKGSAKAAVNLEDDLEDDAETGAGTADGDDDEDDDDDDDDSDEESDDPLGKMRARGAKRKNPGGDASGNTKAKTKRKPKAQGKDKPADTSSKSGRKAMRKKFKGSAFASAEDFASLLNED